MLMRGEGVIIDIWGGMQKNEPPDFRFPEVGISELCTTTIVQTHSLM